MRIHVLMTPIVVVKRHHSRLVPCTMFLSENNDGSIFGYHGDCSLGGHCAAPPSPLQGLNSLHVIISVTSPALGTAHPPQRWSTQAAALQLLGITEPRLRPNLLSPPVFPYKTHPTIALRYHLHSAPLDTQTRPWHTTKASTPTGYPLTQSPNRFAVPQLTKNCLRDQDIDSSSGCCVAITELGCPPASNLVCSS